MEKDFFDVFPSLKVKKELEELLDMVFVTRVSCNPSRTHIWVYIKSERWIHKKHIFELEEQIERQIFAGLNVTVTVIEKFRLSGQYNPQNFLETYRSSMELELRSYNMLEYNMFRQAQISFPGENDLHMILPDSVIAREKSGILIEYLQKVFCERCGMDLKVELEFRETQESKYRKNAAVQIAQEVENVIRHAKLNSKNEEPAQSEEAGTAEKKAEKKTDKGQQEKKDKKAAFADRKDNRKGDFRGGFRRDSNPDVIYGRDFEGEPVALETITGEMGEVIVRGQVMEVEAREIRNEKTILIFPITDFTDSIVVKMFLRNEQVPEVTEHVKKGAFLKFRGVTTVDRFDSELTIASIAGIKKIANFTTARVDTSPQKRVELHCHTKMSDMDGVTDAKSLVKRAYEWGHPAIAITDHGVVQAFPEANHCFDAWGGCVPKDSDFKVLYGMEGYLVDDLKGMVTNGKGQKLNGRFVVFDIETTGFSSLTCQIIEIGAVLVENGEITDRFSTFVNPKVPIPFRIEQLTSINDSMVMDAPTIEEVLPKFLEFSKDAVMVAHNADFDMGFIMKNCDRLGIAHDFTYVDTVGMARFLLPALNRFKLDTVAKAVGVSLENHHRAVDDAACTAEIFVKFVKMLEERDIRDVDMLNEQGAVSVNTIRKLPTYHVIIFARNETGRINLYKLVSQSHLKYYHRRPRVPKSVLEQYRDGLLVGSACEAGELYQAILRNAPDTEIARLVNFYDYLEIQPVGNNRFMIADDKHDMISSEEDLKEINRKIVKLGEQFKKPVVATCDVHFMDPQDEIYRRIIMAGNGFSDADEQAPLYLRTTEEMLEEFAYLGSEKAEEVVITNTNKIADMIEKISPIHPDKFPPVIENSDQDLKNICFTKAHEMYGDPLPEIVESRLDRELNSIISNGYAVMYIIAQKLVWKSNEDGYLVGSRGSVGSSFAATMAGITEVNPLSPHYLCPKCFYNEFYSEDVKKFAGGAGCDMPDKICPNCGHKLNKLGFDIPFETFLGFKGDKEPDIDLNFSGVYQPVIHKYTETFFGKGKVFKAGTIGTVAEKTAFGYVKKYCEERNLVMRNAEMKRLAKGCEGVKRTSGQHPGGIIVVPFENDIHEFCPVQHPADDPNSDIITTHFDYHKIDQNLLKLDELGHDDPTVIRMLEDITGLHARDIPIGDPETMSLFTSNKALKLLPGKDIGTNLGTYGIPEFGTKFVRQMLEDTKPTTFSELVRISGLSHGTDVWLGNAQELIREGKCDLSHSICARDDIMIYLISCGVEEEHSFKIMEMVRKGKGLTPEYEQEMRDNNVPDWYIESCKKIKYMFPKAHAAAYVMSAFRIAYFKVHYPEAFYIAYYTVRADDFDASVMARGEERVREEMRSINAKKKDGTVTPKEENLIPILEICIEMYARGINFVPVDLYESHATDFRQVEGGILPPLSALPGLSENDAISITEERKNGEFRNVEDLRIRTGIGKNPLNILEENGCFDDLPDTDQVSLFD